ncbi:MARCKS-like protein [Burkholderia pseudomallei MSHR6137]|nr:MARCKS-like protein [Burkholderia pseudomallei MSHR6137]
MGNGVPAHPRVRRPAPAAANETTSAHALPAGLAASPYSPAEPAEPAAPAARAPRAAGFAGASPSSSALWNVAGSWICGAWPSAGNS